MKAMSNAIAFDDITKVAPYQVTVALASVEKILAGASGVHNVIQQYMRDAMNLFLEKSKRPFEGLDDEEISRFYANFTKSLTWEEVVDAFKTITFRDQTRPYPLCEHVLRVQEHFEEIVNETVEELNGHHDLKIHVLALLRATSANRA